MNPLVVSVFGETQFAPLPKSTLNTNMTEQGDVAVTVSTCIREVLGSNLARNTGYPD
jgi:hypothetical protein